MWRRAGGRGRRRFGVAGSAGAGGEFGRARELSRTVRGARSVGRSQVSCGFHLSGGRVGPGWSIEPGGGQEIFLGAARASSGAKWKTLERCRVFQAVWNGLFIVIILLFFFICTSQLCSCVTTDKIGISIGYV